MRGQSLHVDRRTCENHLEVRTARKQSLDVTKQEVDVEASLVGLVDDDGVVRVEPRIGARLGEQNAVGHHFEKRVAACLVVEAHLDTNDAADAHAEFIGDATRDTARSEAPRLRVSNATDDPPTEF